MYYFFRTSSDPKVIGVRNGIYQAEFDKNCFSTKEGFGKYQKLFSAGKIVNEESQIKEVVSELVNLNLLKSARLTDFLQFSPHLPGVKFLISDRLKNILENFRIADHHFYKTSILDQKTNREHPYYFFYYKSIPITEIVFSKSELFTRKVDIVDGATKFIDTFYPINDEHNYRILTSTLFLPNFSRICIASKYKNHDYINVNNHAFISEELKQRIIDIGITGITFNDQCELIFD